MNGLADIPFHKTQALQSKALSYKFIDAEARSMRNNIVIYGLTENIHRDAKNLDRAFFENELDIDTSEMYIERAYRIEKGPRTNESKRPLVIRFRDYVDTEIIMEKAYKLKAHRLALTGNIPGKYPEYDQSCTIATKRVTREVDA
ncbi:hypothetical protein DPMN_152606 [Dreissena polymorpha]|uniref:Uncharacterized protein n=1 Tax=Dreissena polymorpha TaxID=45954 RepID=A0A9D4FIL5_DREPO|nr:hypothetical protein DPMN_152606 [Dreissena polymorpha]